MNMLKEQKKKWKKERKKRQLEYILFDLPRPCDVRMKKVKKIYED
jgi:hypothetical protein